MTVYTHAIYSEFIKSMKSATLILQITVKYMFQIMWWNINLTNVFGVHCNDNDTPNLILT